MCIWVPLAPPLGSTVGRDIAIRFFVFFGFVGTES